MSGFQTVNLLRIPRQIHVIEYRESKQFQFVSHGFARSIGLADAL